MLQYLNSHCNVKILSSYDITQFACCLLYLQIYMRIYIEIWNWKIRRHRKPIHTESIWKRGEKIFFLILLKGSVNSISKWDKWILIENVIEDFYLSVYKNVNFST